MELAALAAASGNEILIMGDDDFHARRYMPIDNLVFEERPRRVPSRPAAQMRAVGAGTQRAREREAAKAAWVKETYGAAKEG